MSAGQSAVAAIDPGMSETELDASVKNECLRIQFAQSPLPSTGIFFVTLLVAIPAWIYVPKETLVWLVAGMLANQAAMLSLSQWVHRQKKHSFSLRTLSQLATFIYVMNGIAVGVLTVTLYWFGGQPMFLFVVLVQLGLAAGSLGTSAYHPPAMLGYLLASHLVFISYLLANPRTFEVNVVCAGLVFNMIYVIAMGFQQSRTILTAIRLRHQNENLLERLRQQTAFAESARAEAENSSQEKSRFFASASHDLRQPVHAINVYVSLLNSDQNRAEQEEILTRVRSCVSTLNELFNSLLSVEHAERAQLDNGLLRPVSLNELLDSVVNQYGPLAQDRGLDLRHIPSSLWVAGEPVAAERLLANLVSNAIRFTPSGRILIGVRRRGPKAELMVLDTGIGIKPEDQQRIFDEFFQAGNPGRHADRGYGLGLVIVRRLSEALAFEVSVRSTPGRGSCFSVMMPVVAPPRPAHSHAGKVRNAKFSTAPRVMFVDDDPHVRDAMRLVFIDWGVNASICQDSNDALQAARSSTEQWDCLLVDQRLDEQISGLELAQTLCHTLPNKPPVAIVTGEDLGEWTTTARSLGYTILPKPVKMHRLRAFIASSQRRSPSTIGHPVA